VSQGESEHNEVDGMKKGVDSKGEVMHTGCVQLFPYANSRRQRVYNYYQDNLLANILCCNCIFDHIW